MALSASLGGRGRKSSGLLLVAILFVVQLASWRGTQRIRAVNLSSSAKESTLQRRALSAWTSDPFSSEDRHEKDKRKSKHQKKSKDKKHSSTSSSSSTKQSSTSSTARSHTSTLSSTLGLPTTTTRTFCRPLPTDSTPEDLCLHVRSNCPPTGHLDYLQFFYCVGLDVQATPSTTTATLLATEAPRATSLAKEDSDAEKKPGHHDVSSNVELLRVLALILIISWMLFLFSWVGIVASDFFCPNLSTLAARLGLSESTAGVTFLAFGNGSPDVFSTFGAMRTGSGSLAIGELLGAASFIVSVISGSMMLIAPFRVKPFPFLRDVGFFTIAVSMTLVFLFDGKLRFGECISLIALYFLYAATIIIGSWWQERRRLRKLRLANIRSENSVLEDGQDGNSAAEAQTPNGQLRHSPYYGPMSAIEYEPDVDPFASWIEDSQRATANGGHLTPISTLSSNPSPVLMPVDLPTASTTTSAGARLQRFRSGMLARHSLLGAVEFRDVVQNLRRESSADRSMEVYQSRDPERFLPHSHQHHHHQHNLASDARPDESPGRRHSRTKSLHRPRTRRFLSQSSAEVRNSLIRSRSTIGASAENGPLVDVERPTLEQIGQSSRLAAAVGDPWREHGPDDGCEATTSLPAPAIPLSNGGVEELEQDQVAREGRKAAPTLPRLVIRQATAPPHDAGAPLGLSGKQHRSENSLSWQAKRASRPDVNTSSRKIFKSVVRQLFPSLRHLREKSWLGLAIGIITAPAIFLLNLTLPVVDDEAEKAMMAGEKHFDYQGASDNGTGRIRLEGSEAPILAHDRSAFADESDDDAEEGNRRDVIDLNGTPTNNPWDVSTDVENEDEVTEENRKDNLEVATALRHLPADASPLLIGTRQYDSAASDVGDDESCASDESCRSDDSHTSSHTSRLVLGIAQCIFAPPFCVWTITSSARSKHVYAKTSAAFVGGLALAGLILLVILPARRYARRPPSLRFSKAVGWIRVAMGFFVSILYIMTIVDEVVSILQTLGLVLGLSDAILGLTVFAMGNSLGDLVANITIAKMGHPVMAISACFAGPLLNLLLGIGISGSWLLSGNRNPTNLSSFAGNSMTSTAQDNGVYLIDFSPTLTVSGCGLLLILLGTLICVPLNGFKLDRRMGTLLIATYVVIMTVNIGVEIYNLHS